MKTRLIVFLCCFWAVSIQAQQKPATIDVEDVISRLTLEEKVKIVVGAGMKMPGQEEGQAAVGQTEDKVPGAAGTSQKNERLNFPTVVFADGPAGVRISPTRESNPGETFYATAFPVATLVAATFNTDLMEEVGAAFGNEVKEYGVDVLLAPALNIHRVPLGGRNFEYYSEDPVLSGKMAAAFVRGVQSQGVGTSIKHYAANNQETNRTKLNAIIGERALREIYLKGFEIAVKESDPWTVMSAYNKINGEYASENRDLLRTILRDEWGYDGFVMTDWFAGENPAKQMEAGNDLLMPGTPQQEQAILKAVKEGTLSEEILNRNVAAILNVYTKTPAFLGYKPSGKPELEAHKAIARKAAAEGMVLLKNEKNTLPLQNLRKPLALLGVGSYQTISGGTGSGDVNKAYAVSVAEGLKKNGFTISPALVSKYQTYVKEENAKVPPKKMFFEPDVIIPELEWSEKQLDSLAELSSVGIYTLSRTSGEFQDRKMENDFSISKAEEELIRKAAKAFHKKGKKFVVLLNVGGVIETASWKEQPDAILVMWQPGQEGGHAVADILSGAVNPSAKLPMTFPVRYEDDAASRNFPGIELEENPNPGGFSFMGIPAEVVYEEGIFVGYRYFDSFDVPVSYPFGYGLSYTNFSFTDLKLNQQPDGSVKVNFGIKNSGKKAGKEVGQVYLSAPEGELSKPDKELKAFVKTRVLKPGESQQFEVLLQPKDLASFNPESSSWVTEKGTYTLRVGSAINKLPLKATLEKQETRVVEKTNKVLLPRREINLLEK